MTDLPDPLPDKQWWEYEVLEVWGSMDDKLEVGQHIIDRWVGERYDYSVWDFAMNDVVGGWQVKLVGPWGGPPPPGRPDGTLDA